MSGTQIYFIPYPSSGSSGGGSGASQITNGSITTAGQDGNVAQAIQGIAGGIPLVVEPLSTKGIDHSSNAPAGPGTATSFTFNGNTVNLLQTVAVNPNRVAIEVNNTTGAPVVVVTDDGFNTSGRVSLFPLAPGSGQYQQGADLTLTTELGRVRIFGTTGTYCYVREN